MPEEEPNIRRGTLVDILLVGGSVIEEVGPRDGTNVIVLQFVDTAGEPLDPVFLMLGDAGRLSMLLHQAVEGEALKVKAAYGSL